MSTKAFGKARILYICAAFVKDFPLPKEGVSAIMRMHPGTFASAAGGGRSEQKGVAAAEILRAAASQRFRAPQQDITGQPVVSDNYISKLPLKRELTYMEGYRSGHNGAVLKTVG